MALPVHKNDAFTTANSSGGMPPGGPVGGDIPAAQLTALKTWINAGAPDN